MDKKRNTDMQEKFKISDLLQIKGNINKRGPQFMKPVRLPYIFKRYIRSLGKEYRMSEGTLGGQI